WLYFVKQQGYVSSLWRMPTAGRDETQVVSTVYRYNFAPTDTGVYYGTPGRGATPSSIEYLDLATGKVATLYTLSKPVDLGLAISPDRRYVLFAQSDVQGSDLMFVDHFQ